MSIFATIFPKNTILHCKTNLKKPVESRDVRAVITSTQSCQPIFFWNHTHQIIKYFQDIYLMKLPAYLRNPENCVTHENIPVGEYTNNATIITSKVRFKAVISRN